MKKAQSLVEYALILVLISLIAVTTLNWMGKNMSLKTNEANIDTEKNVVETMSSYCKLKGLVYNKITNQCEQIAQKEE
ncbi:hypothetical protein IJS77_03165 [bacterium]|nr:hypothetical protein [bacterium]